jgi:hypothetical protein
VLPLVAVVMKKLPKRILKAFITVWAKPSAKLHYKILKWLTNKKTLFLIHSNDIVMTEYPICSNGGGSWATAIAKMLCVNLSEISWYMRTRIGHRTFKTLHNPNYLSSVEFDIKN